MPLDPTPNASLFSLAAELDARSAALHAAAYSSAPFLSQSNGTGTDTYQYPPDQIKVDKPPLRLQVPRRCVPEGTSVWDTVTWETRDAKIVDKDGNTVFEQRNVRVPSTWSQTAVNVVASKYFRLVNGVRETGVDQMIQRVSATITEWGIRDGYFEPETAAVFAAELQYLLLHQMTAFNSPVWFNIGVPGSKNQASACFIIDVEDSMESILEWYRQEGLIFQGGSGAGVNVSKVRGNGEPLSSGGTSSGILSFMKAADRSSGAIKSGGSVRRAAKMVQMDIDHPDIKAFITCKQHEEAKARILIAAGYDPGLDGEAYETVAFQNANHSVVVPDAFLRAVEADGPWQLTRRVDGVVTETVSARALFRLIAETAHSCGDPGIFFSDTANQWHTTPTQGPIRGTNPCISKGSMIYTRNGWMPIETLTGLDDVEIFDGVDFSEGSVWKTGKKKIVRIHTNNGRTLDLTEDHRIYTERGWIEAKSALGLDIPYLTPSLMIQGEGQLPRCITGGSGHFYSAYSIDLMESLGFIQGDGSFNKSSRTVNIHFTSEKDGEFVLGKVVPILADIAADIGEIDYFPSLKEEHTYTISRKKLFEWLSVIGFDFNHLPERMLPSFIWKVKRPGQCAFLRGLFGANGNVLKDARNGVVLVSSNKKLLQQVQIILQSLGIASNVRIHNKSQEVEWKNGIYTSRESYHLEITHQQDIYHFSKMIGFPQTSQTEKLSKAISLNPNQSTTVAHYRERMKIVKVEDLDYEEDVYDFRVESTSCGLINGILVHNCSEFLRPPDEACNLSCLNLLKFLRDDGSYDIDLFTHAVDIMITAKEILVGHSNYPTEAITKNSHAYRTLGQGYANLGGLLMAKGLPYDSEAGRNYAASITALMTGEAYVQSARLASVTGPFSGFLPDKDAMMMIIQQHRDRVNHRETNWRDTDADLWDAASRVWLQAERLGYTHGYRNAQVSLLMPAGTVGLMMGCGTTGVEPDVALVNYKALVGGGTIKKVNEIVPQALQRLGYNETTIHQAQEYIEAHGTLEGFQWIQEKHLPVFDCAFPTTPGGRSIHWRGHMLMVAALQPFLSMGISKTINMPHDATVEDVEAAYLEAWHRGCKSIAIYRDGSKYTQVVTTRDVGSTHAVASPAPVAAAVPYRRRLPDERAALTHKFQVGDQEGYLTVGLYDDGTPGEIFIHISKEGSTISGLIDAFATSISMALQYGVPLQALCDKFQHSRFAPSGFTHHPQIRIATSVTDYIFRYLALKFLDPVAATDTGTDPVPGTGAVAETGSAAASDYGSGVCNQCGGLLRITGNCSVCTSCGMSMGCS